MPSQSDPADKPPEERAFIRQRRGAPLNKLLPRTAEWMGTLQTNFQPKELARQFPRIANAMAAAWPEPVTCEAYFDDLLIDRRDGKRAGFSPEVLRELKELRRYYAHVQKKVVLEWKDGKWI